VSWLKSQKWGIRVAAVWFILYGVDQFVSFKFARWPELLGSLAIAAGVLILMDR
jgi:hypothetical protein